jgi:general secretion pathway protein G
MNEQRSKRGQKGFTLIELLVVVIILGMLAALVVPKFIGRTGPARQQAAKTQMGNFEMALDMFRLDTGRYPTTDEGLKALREKPSGVERWEGPYLKKELPLDPWGKPYVYRSPGDHGDYDIMALGLDGVEGGEGENQDILSWQDIKK